MAVDEKKAASVANYIRGRAVVPFTGGIVIFLWAFFGPESYGRWLGTIVRAFRDSAGF